MSNLDAQNTANTLTLLGEALAAPKRVTVWRIVSKDPDEISEYSGVLIRETDQVYEIQLAGDSTPTTFPKLTNQGVTVWRLA